MPNKISKAARAERLQAVQKAMSSIMSSRPADVQRQLQAEGITIPHASISRYITQAKNDNWQWLNDTARSAYIANLRTRAEYIQNAINRTAQCLQDESLKPHGRAQLNTSLVVLSKEMSDLIEGLGLMRHWDALINHNDPAWQAIAKSTPLNPELEPGA